VVVGPINNATDWNGNALSPRDEFSTPVLHGPIPRALESEIPFRRDKPKEARNRVLPIFRSPLLEPVCLRIIAFLNSSVAMKMKGQFCDCNDSQSWSLVAREQDRQERRKKAPAAQQRLKIVGHEVKTHQSQAALTGGL